MIFTFGATLVPCRAFASQMGRNWVYTRPKQIHSCVRSQHAPDREREGARQNREQMEQNTATKFGLISVDNALAYVAPFHTPFSPLHMDSEID